LEEYRQELYRRFCEQQQFSASYSPLYCSLFGAVAEWLAERPLRPAASWLLDAAATRAAFDVTNLLAAAVHRDVLAGLPATERLRAYYPSVGGTAVSGKMVGREWLIESGFREALEQAILLRRPELRSFILSNTVQTNETGRGLAWLLPTAVAGMESVYLLDLGASAGLNLVADQRRFTLVDEADGRVLAHFGRGPQTEFTVQASGWPAGLPPDVLATPVVLGRTGGDLHPFLLTDEEDERRLAAFVWADQVERLARLRAGMDGLKEVGKGNTAVHLHALSLPEGLPAFLNSVVRPHQMPVICYNTYIRMYLPAKGAALHEHIASWATRQAGPVIWLQWEPPGCLVRETGPAPHDGWLAWTIDLWRGTDHRQWQLGWVHPHGQQIQFTAGFQAWIAYWHQMTDREQYSPQ
jgi:hypothetical protein